VPLSKLVNSPLVNLPPVPVSILILTRNEETNIHACLAQFSFSNDVVVLDSFSTDRTMEIAKRFPNVRVIQRHFDTEYKQRNYGLHDIEYKHPWVYICDADERVPTDLVQEISARVADSPPDTVAYRLRYKNMFLGKWIKHASSYPVWVIRLVRPAKVTYEVRETNVHPIAEGTVGELKHHFIHFSFNAGLNRWFEKHNFYSTREALEGVKVRKEGIPSPGLLMNKDPMLRRRALKNLSYFLIGRSVWRFLHGYIVRGGFLDRTAGFHYCMMISTYEYWIELKMREQASQWPDRTTQLATRLLAERPS
jgi:glycosyltransferase involved in cell wall biosynthesis